MATLFVTSSIMRSCLFLMILTQLATAQAPDTLWTRTFGGSDPDDGRSIQQTTDGGYIILGNTVSYSASMTDVWLIKTDASGDTLWTRSYAYGFWHNWGYDIQQTSDGGYILTGTFWFRQAGENNWDIFLTKTDVAGDTLWTKIYGGFGIDHGYSVQQTSDGGYIITGTRDFSDVYLIKTDTLGDTLWTKTFGGIDTDIGYTVRQTTDGGFIIVGITSSYGAGASDVWLIKTDISGDTLWTKTFGGVEFDEGHSIQQTIDGGYIITGNTDSYGAGDSDVWLIKTDATGDTLWTKTLGGGNSDEGYSVQQTSDGGYIIAGTTQSFGAGSSDVWIIRLASQTSPELVTPVITAVTDVPNDQGRWVYLSWSPSLYDELGEITQYGVWELNLDEEWVSLGNVPAVQEDGYIFLAHTFADSTDEGIYWSVFKVTAHTTDPEVYYTSAVDSGYSIDNLAPAVPTGLLASVTESNQVRLNWDAPVDEDFNTFKLYRSLFPDFDPTGIEPFAETIDTAFTDSDVDIGETYYYILSAVDFNGNESEYSDIVSVEVLSIHESMNIPTVFALHQNHPNPFNPVTTLHYDIPKQSVVELTVYDILGRHVRTLVNGVEDPGFKSVVWDGTNDLGEQMSSGVYLYRIHITDHDGIGVGNHDVTLKMVLFK